MIDNKLIRNLLHIRVIHFYPIIDFELIVDVPYSFQIKMKNFAEGFKNKKVSLLDAVNWVIKRVITSGIELVKCIDEEISPKVRERMDEIYNEFMEKNNKTRL
jgi:hypothetical protein